MKWFLFNKVNLVSYLLGQNMLMLIVSCLTIVYVGLVIIVYIKSKKSGGFDNLPFVKNMWYFLINPRLVRRPPYFFRGSLFPGQARKLIPDCFFALNRLDITTKVIFHILAPIKRPLSRKNTSPSQKRIFFLQGHHPVRDQSLVVACIRVFKIYWCGFLFDLLPGTHQDQGQWKKK